jgi:hypothetical protein
MGNLKGTVEATIKPQKSHLLGIGTLKNSDPMASFMQIFFLFFLISTHLMPQSRQTNKRTAVVFLRHGDE